METRGREGKRVMNIIKIYYMYLLKCPTKIALKYLFPQTSVTYRAKAVH
jgi:hypothetical protein